jgi:signal transduction histidine kinase
MTAHENLVRVALEEDLPQLQTDRKKLQTILFNLLENAGKFTKKGTVSLEAWLEEGMVRIDVRDTGMGMDPDQVERIFQGFTQVDESSTRRIGGIGLAQMLEGTIEVRSEVGKGTCFTLRLPLVAHRRSTAMTFTPSFDLATPKGPASPGSFRESVPMAWSFMPGTEKP